MAVIPFVLGEIYLVASIGLHSVNVAVRSKEDIPYTLVWSQLMFYTSDIDRGYTVLNFCLIS